MHIREKKHRLHKDCYQGNVIVSFTLCINGRKPLFSEPNIVNIFRDILADCAKKSGFLIPSFCFMPDHLHLIVMGTQDDVNLLKFINQYKQKTGFWMAKNHPAFAWQKDYFDHIIRKDENLPAVVRYILENPVRKGLVSDWRDYPFKGAIGCSLDDVIEGLI